MPEQAEANAYDALQAHLDGLSGVDTDTVGAEDQAAFA